VLETLLGWSAHMLSLFAWTASRAKDYREHAPRIRELAKEARVWKVKKQLEYLAERYAVPNANRRLREPT
jgi:hypothetical protein